MATRERRLNLTVRRRRNGDKITGSTLLADPDDTAALQQALRDLLTADHWDEGRFGEFELEVAAGDGSRLGTVTTAGRRP